ncbi:hypothetical protein I6I99_09985 [Sphingobacterium multivorum]|nr:hypothetical protein [Sphingobacterium multivorum]QQT32863.1 hypothetical protein I6I99_09985 [Sphingobacterium multivorum]
MAQKTKNISFIGIIVLSITIYFSIILLVKWDIINNFFTTEKMKSNEMGDYIGGILNPLFTFLSTVAILLLTNKISQNEDEKAEKAIEVQKRISLNHMRQNALDNLIQKTNLYVHEMGTISFYKTKNKFHSNILSAMLKEDEKEDENKNKKIIVWLVILNELENFLQRKHLFSNLFDNAQFNSDFQELMNITSEICEEQRDLRFVKTQTIEKYIDLQQRIIYMIGDYVYSEL